jgi:hypothetical protein
MSFPETVDEIIRQDLANVQANPEGQLLPYERDHIYKLLGNRVRGWLSVISVKRVSNILENQLHYPEALLDQLTLPSQALDIATQVLAGNIDVNDKIFRTAKNRLYHSSGNSWGNNNLPWSSYLVGIAVYVMLLDVEGFDFFRLLRCDSENPGYYQSKKGKVRRVCLDQTLTDDDIPEPLVGTADPSSYAAKAYAFTRLHETDLEIIPEYDNQKRREFWVWWLTEAIPLAWGQANKHR